MLSGTIPCGCEARKDVIFTRGELGRRELAIMGTAAIILALAYVGRGHHA